MKRYGSELKFLCRIKPDGSGLEKVEDNLYATDLFKLNCLSITNRTWIASGMSSFIVKLKNDPNLKW